MDDWCFWGEMGYVTQKLALCNSPPQKHLENALKRVYLCTRFSRIERKIHIDKHGIRRHKHK